MTWTLEGELRKAAELENLPEALERLGLLPSTDCDFTLSSEGDWKRSGAETYIYKFCLSTPEGSLNLLFKACVAMDLVRGVEGLLAEWISRRQLLALEGVQTPRLYFHGNGLLLEEYIQFGLPEVLTSATASVRLGVIGELTHYAASLVKLGFCPVDAFKDLRSRGTDVVAIDFGEDLGAADQEGADTDGVLLQLRKALDQWGIGLTEKERYFLESAAATIKPIK